MIDPPEWTAEGLERERQRAIEEFRRERFAEPADAYAKAVSRHREIVQGLLDSCSELQALGDEQLLGILADKESRLAFRYLAGPPISEDDLKTLADVGSLAPSSLKDDPKAIRRLADVVVRCLDRERFPWIGEGRPPTAEERRAAVLASACLMAYQRVQADRRTSGKERLEGVVRSCLLEFGLTEVARREVQLLSDAPEAGSFCGETSCAGRRADYVVGLWDGRHMLVECKDSNSLVNSIKRLNNDTAAKAAYWIRTFGERAVVPVAVISGVYYLESLERAQRTGLTLFWGHELEKLAAWLRSVQESV